MLIKTVCPYFFAVVDSNGECSSGSTRAEAFIKHWKYLVEKYGESIAASTPIVVYILAYCPIPFKDIYLEEVTIKEV